jgi:hypothetical protein
VKNSNVIVPNAQPPAASRGFNGFGRNGLPLGCLLSSAEHGIDGNKTGRHHVIQPYYKAIFFSTILSAVRIGSGGVGGSLRRGELNGGGQGSVGTDGE